MNQPPAEPSRATDPGGGTLTMDQVIQIVTTTTHQTREPPEEKRGMIERALKLGAKTYDGIGHLVMSPKLIRFLIHFLSLL